jgi:hypothetical protein
VPALVYCTALAASMTVLPILRRIFSLMAGDGDSSSSFWWRRWIEHSRSPRCDVAELIAEHLELDVAAIPRTSRCRRRPPRTRGFGFALRRLHRVGQFARHTHDAHAAAAAAGGALTMTGYPISFATFSAFSSLSTGPSLPGRIGTPALRITLRARDCRP